MYSRSRSLTFFHPALIFMLTFTLPRALFDETQNLLIGYVALLSPGQLVTQRDPPMDNWIHVSRKMTCNHLRPCPAQRLLLKGCVRVTKKERQTWHKSLAMIFYKATLFMVVPTRTLSTCDTSTRAPLSQRLNIALLEKLLGCTLS